ncbi:hypothetical protein Zmor_008875 [Zophobas morio]|jgi:protein DJ-1|uniref:DJ-1/PfpI domain-containing protein n=1 Tax=Zophobas morio TaxID=2755281 RepID=A0AA38HHW3_9CUCU|nr:hypothetical protein Zmor_008875 [Zophobas morio]
MPCTVLAILAKGAEELELVTVVNILRRGGAAVVIAGLNGLDPVKCSKDVVIVPDQELEKVKKDLYDMVFIPGGLEGAKACAGSELVNEVLNRHYQNNKYIATICAGPLSLINHGIARGSCVTSHPCIKEQLVKEGYSYKEQPVCVDGRICTSRGPGTALLFGLKLVEVLFGEEKYKEVCKPLMIP